ncbi:hypothetical protein OIK44_11785 [Janthinobacterium sp. hw3]|uniref:Uncharacterized protein n=2 Tax=Janthinobacterium fluminis TaxID=2987524 RepID=A0ABT5JZV9_9BURK|nr:DUF6713 family protein [Janthinobacterium fluminis]MDC8758270.1 hypothetical protein [Janthinobacterium fluminis]
MVRTLYLLTFTLLMAAIHAGFLLAGFAQFELPLSLAIIAGCGLAGLALLAAARAAQAEFSGA